jgi:ribosomal protein S1
MELLRRSPTGMPRLKGKVLSGVVVPSDDRGKFVRVDAGWRAHVSLLRAELEAAQRAPVRVGAEVQLAVEHLETPLGEAALDAERARDNERVDYVWQEIKDAYSRGLQVKARLQPLFKRWERALAPQIRVSRDLTLLTRLLTARGGC